jgi:predicted RNase H-like nuclease (RuvC/YqgF family)
VDDFSLGHVLTAIAGFLGALGALAATLAGVARARREDRERAEHTASERRAASRKDALDEWAAHNARLADEITRLSNREESLLARCERADRRAEALARALADALAALQAADPAAADAVRARNPET